MKHKLRCTSSKIQDIFLRINIKFHLVILLPSKYFLSSYTIFCQFFFPLFNLLVQSVYQHDFKDSFMLYGFNNFSLHVVILYRKHGFHVLKNGHILLREKICTIPIQLTPYLKIQFFIHKVARNLSYVSLDKINPLSLFALKISIILVHTIELKP